jgi:hypothetical protein
LTFTPAPNVNVAVVRVPFDVNGVVVQADCVVFRQALESEMNSSVELQFVVLPEPPKLAVELPELAVQLVAAAEPFRVAAGVVLALAVQLT